MSELGCATVDAAQPDIEPTHEQQMTALVGQRLCTARLLRGWSLCEASLRSHVPVESLGQYEAGEQIIGVVELARIALAYGFGFDDLLGLRGDEDGREALRRAVFDRPSIAGMLQRGDLLPKPQHPHTILTAPDIDPSKIPF